MHYCNYIFYERKHHRRAQRPSIPARNRRDSAAPPTAARDSGRWVFGWDGRRRIVDTGTVAGTCGQTCVQTCAGMCMGTSMAHSSRTCVLDVGMRIGMLAYGVVLAPGHKSYEARPNASSCQFRPLRTCLHTCLHTCPHTTARMRPRIGAATMRHRHMSTRTRMPTHKLRLRCGTDTARDMVYAGAATV